jgi:hypothetical protein
MILLQNDGACRKGRPLFPKTSLSLRMVLLVLFKNLPAVPQQDTFIISLDTQCTLVN